MQKGFNTYFFRMALLFSLASGQRLYAQQATFFSQSELGLSIGQMYYIGDLNPYKPFNHNQWAGSLMYRYNLHSRIALRLNYTMGSVKAYDYQSRNSILVNRNLDFESKIRELAGGIEFYFSPFVFGRKDSRKRLHGTAYFLTQLGVFYMNPTTTINGEKIELRPLGTEGQGTSVNKEATYSNFQLCVPLGLGFKAQLGKNLTFNVEMAIRKTFTDYLDDVSGANYVDEAIIESVNGSVAAELSNRSLDGARNGYRGNPTTKDWYVYAGGMISMRLGGGRKCFKLR